jgi:hypothetical protein
MVAILVRLDSYFFALLHDLQLERYTIARYCMRPRILRHSDQLVRDGGVSNFKRKMSRAIMVNRERVTHYDRR